jgi:AraC family transcriptional regulator
MVMGTASVRYQSNEDYAAAHVAAQGGPGRIDLGGVGVLVDRAPVGSVRFEDLPSTILLVDCAGIAARDCVMGRAAFRGPSAAGTMSLMPAGLPVDFAWSNPVPSACIVLDFDTETVARVLPEAGITRITRSLSAPVLFRQAERMHLLAQLVQIEVEENRAGPDMGSDDLARLMLIEALRQCSGDGPDEARRFRMDRRLARAVDHIEAHLGEPIRLAVLAAECGLSQTHLSTLFRAEFGTSPHAYVIDRRLDYARRLLAAGDQPIAAIALDRGFADQAHLTRMFVLRLGTTPARCRADSRRRVRGPLAPPHLAPAPSLA